MPEVTRFAPSPTGWLHLGHAYAALFAQEKAAGGRFLIRLEDIDGTRARPEYEGAIFEDLAWLGLEWEVPVRRQSDHFEDYRVALAKLEALGVLYPCFCSRADIRAAILRTLPEDGSTIGNGRMRELIAAELDADLTEADYFAAIGLPFVPPADRSALDWFQRGRRANLLSGESA